MICGTCNEQVIVFKDKTYCKCGEKKQTEALFEFIEQRYT